MIIETPMTDAAVIPGLGAPNWIESRFDDVVPASFARELERRIAEMENHERQTHEILGAILGTDDTLEVCALRMKNAIERIKAIRWGYDGDCGALSIINEAGI